MIDSPYVVYHTSRQKGRGFAKMSVWTHVKCEIRLPERVVMEELQKVFGKEMDLHYPTSSDYHRKTPDGFCFDEEAYDKAWEEADVHNAKEWAEYEAHKDEYLPCGSEGTLRYERCRRSARKTDDGKFVYRFDGALRDRSCEDGIVKWFRDRFLRWNIKHDWTFEVYAKVSASSGVGELSWEYGKYD